MAAINTDCAQPMPKLVDPHYLTPEHRAWASEVIRRAGGRCEWEENDRRCERAEPAFRMVADHIVEIADGGSKLDLANGQCLCIKHNTAKGYAARRARHAERA